MIRYLLDTNIVIYVIKRRPPEVLDTFNRHAAHMAMSAVTLAELMHGAEKSVRTEENLLVVEDFASRLEVLPYGARAAQHYGQIRARLEQSGQPIGVTDLHIAAHARSEGLTLVTNNLGEFSRVPGLLVENWVVAPSPPSSAVAKRARKR
jgi:tRNA(fMet)-specific endonuclease VapC